MSELYFAYGSNMSTARLQERIPSARVHGAASIADYRLVCNKRGKDGSGKANLEARAGSIAWGVVFELVASDWERLDRFEWGYERASARVATMRHSASGVSDVQLYFALAPDREPIPPFEWYRDHCLRGAREHRLPRDVIEEIARWDVRTP